MMTAFVENTENIGFEVLMEVPESTTFWNMTFVWSGRNLTSFRRIALPPFSDSNNEAK